VGLVLSVMNTVCILGWFGFFGAPVFSGLLHFLIPKCPNHVQGFFAVAVAMIAFSMSMGDAMDDGWVNVYIICYYADMGPKLRFDAVGPLDVLRKMGVI